MSLRRAAVLDLATAAYEIDAGVKRGLLEKKDGRWVIAGIDLDEVLAQYEGEEIVTIFALLNDARPLEERICTRCGNEYTGAECPDCRQSRIRLRGH